MRNVWEQVLPIKTLDNLDARDESTRIDASEHSSAFCAAAAADLIVFSNNREGLPWQKAGMKFVIYFTEDDTQRALTHTTCI
jgi:hypothetical protein